MRFRIIDLDETARGPHNIFLIFGCSCGIFAMLAVMFASLWGLYKASMKFYREKNLCNIVIMISIAGFLLHGMLDVNFQVAASMGIFTSLTMICAEEAKIKVNKYSKFAFYLACSIIMICAIISSYRLTAGEKALDKLKNDIHKALRENNLTTWQIVQDYNEVEKYRPYSPFHALDMYHYYFAKRMYREALPYLDKAIDRSPECAGNYYSKAVYMLTIGDLAGAEKNIDIALKLYPMSQKYRKFKEILKKTQKKH